MAGDIERDLGRPVRWHAPDKKGPKDSGSYTIVVVAIVLVLTGLLLTFIAWNITSTKSNNGSLSSNKQNATTTDKVDTTQTSVSAFLNSKELETLKYNLHIAGSDLDKIVADGNISQIRQRRELVSSALREFEPISAPSQCAQMRNNYVLASEAMVQALDDFYKFYAESNDHDLISDGTANISRATKYMSKAVDEERKLRAS